MFVSPGLGQEHGCIAWYNNGPGCWVLIFPLLGFWPVNSTRPDALYNFELGGTKKRRFFSTK